MPLVLHARVDPESSGLAEDVIYDYSRAYEEHNPGINQFDLTLTYRINRKNHTSSWALQILNVLGRQEFYGYSYNYKTGRVQEDEVRVIVPSISYKIDF